MVTATESSKRKKFISVVSFPCGMARQYRVQCLSENRGMWQKYASYDRADAAIACAEKLTEQGITARVIHHRMMPICG